MANDLNNCQFIGRLGRDVEIRYMPNGNAVASLAVACGEQWKDKQGVKQERTEWVNVTAFDKLAEIMGEYLSKGSQVYIQGKMKTEKYTGNDGVEKYSTKIIANNMQMLGGGNQSAQKPAQQGGYAPKKQAAPQQKPAPKPQQLITPDLDDGWDSDIPF